MSADQLFQEMGKTLSPRSTTALMALLEMGELSRLPQISLSNTYMHTYFICLSIFLPVSSNQLLSQCGLREPRRPWYHLQPGPCLLLILEPKACPPLRALPTSYC